MRYSREKSISTMGIQVYSRILLVLFFSGWYVGQASLAAVPAVKISSYILLKCPLLALTGIFCPTCGLGRSLIYFFKGDLITSLHYHPLGAILLVCFFLFWIVYSISLSYASLIIKNVKGFYLKHSVWVKSLIVVYCIWGFYWRDTMHLH